MSKRKVQQEFVGEGFGRRPDCFGGELLRGNPKSARPLDSRLPIHLTMRASRSVLRLPKMYAVVNKIIYSVGRKHGVKIYKLANVGNHLHLAIKLPRVLGWAAFIRELAGRIGFAMRAIMGGASLWQYRPHTRIVRGWKKAFQIVLDYIELNQWEAEGFISRKDIKTLKDLRLIFGDR